MAKRYQDLGRPKAAHFKESKHSFIPKREDEGNSSRSRNGAVQREIKRKIEKGKPFLT